MNLADLFKQRRHHDPSSPLVTYYDESSGERIELSATSFANWVNKTANLIRDEMGLAEGEAIFLDLPLHWQSLVWVQAAWELGITIVTTPSASLIVTSQANVHNFKDVELMVLSLRPLGLPCNTELPPQAMDYARVVPGNPDYFSGPSIRAQRAAFGAKASHADLIHAAQQLDYPPQTRLLTSNTALDQETLVSTWVAPLLALGSVVVVAGSPTAERIEAIASSEKSTYLAS